MISHRMGRTNDDIRIALSALLRAVKDPRVNQGIVSITRVEATGDLRYAKVYLSALGLHNEKEFIKGINSASGWLRRELGSRLRLRCTPELIFELDGSIAHGAHINQMISALKPAFGQGEKTDDDI